MILENYTEILLFVKELVSLEEARFKRNLKKKKKIKREKKEE